MPTLLAKPIPFAEALDRLAQKRVLPTGLSSAELRGEWPKALRQRALFSARTTKAAILQEYQDKVGELLRGETNIATARMEMQQMFDALGYTPEFGFAGDEAHDIPPAERGSLRDLSSNRRVDLVLMTNMRQCANYGFWEQGQSDFALFAFPCYELVRIYPRVIPRGMRMGKGGWEHVVGEDWPSRWETVGGVFVGHGRMIARKDDPIWHRLGDSSVVPDALDTFVPPYAFGSGYGWREIDRAESIRLGVIEEETDVQPKEHSLNENLVSPSLTIEMLDAALGDLEDYRAQLDEKIAAEKAAARANPAQVSNEPWKFTFTNSNEHLAANSIPFDSALHPHGEHGRWAKVFLAADKGNFGGSNKYKPLQTEAEIAANIQNGMNAFWQVMDTKQDAPGAMSLPGIGLIDFVWERTGEDGKTFGFKHILDRREAEARHRQSPFSPDEEAQALVEVIARGKIANPDRKHGAIEIDHNGFRVILARPNKKSNAWVISGFLKDKEESR